MSGGFYGRGKAPERACMPIAKWPERDREAWARACAPADPLDDDIGARARHSAASNRRMEMGYGRWLTFLMTAYPDCLKTPPADRITTERCRAYVESLIALGNSTGTIQGRLVELREMTKVVAPGLDFGFITVLIAKIRARHLPARSKSHLRFSDELLGLGFRLMDSAKGRDGWKAAVQYRDGLMIALLALVPLRLSNFVALQLGRSLVNNNGAWLITLEAEETKNGSPLEMMWPEQLLAPLSTYLAVHHPLLAARTGRWSKPTDGSLWISSHGSPMTEIAIYDRIVRRTRDAFGNSMNPHLFRDAAATTLAVADPEHVRIAAPLLGHRNFATTEKFYQQAKSLDAHRAYIKAVFGKEDKP
jgi:integrase/recombinase XerD